MWGKVAVIALGCLWPRPSFLWASSTWFAATGTVETVRTVENKTVESMTEGSKIREATAAAGV